MILLDRIERGRQNLSDGDILHLLETSTRSDDFYRLLSLSNLLSRKKFGNRGYVFTQLGINAAPCSKNCRFCSMGAEHYSLDSEWEKDPGTIKRELRNLQEHYFDDLFLITTADFPVEKFLRLAAGLKPLLREDQRFVANIGDFDRETARELKKTGFTGVYHINRLREGTDTMISPDERERTIEAVVSEGLELYYCIEPIGPEHRYEEMLVEIKRARDLGIAVMAVRRRIPVEGTPLYGKGKISAAELTKIAAVTNLVVNPSRAMNIHEPVLMGILAGVNQVYAEAGSNPRDVKSHTGKGRGFTPGRAWEMLWEGGYRRDDFSVPETNLRIDYSGQGKILH